MLKRLSIRQKQMLIIMATSSVALLLAGGAFVLFEVISFRKAMTENLSSLASVVGDNCTAALKFGDRATARELLGTLEKESHFTAACIYDHNGKVFESYLRDQASFQFPPPSAGERHEFTSDYLELFRPIKLKGERIGTIYMRSDLDELYKRLRQFGGIVAIVLTASIIVALLLSIFFQRLVSEPILALARM